MYFNNLEQEGLREESAKHEHVEKHSSDTQDVSTDTSIKRLISCLTNYKFAHDN